MSEHPQPGLHPDPDSLNAFIEGVLPEHERRECMAHLAGCSICREVVYLAQAPLPVEPLRVPAADRVSFRKRWFTPIPALSAAAVCILVLSVALYRYENPAPTARELVATAPIRATELAPPPEPAKQPLAVSPSIPKTARKAQRAIQQPETPPTPAVTAAPAVSVPATPPPAISPPLTLPSTPPPQPGRESPQVETRSTAIAGVVTPSAPIATQSGIAGTITDPTGSVIPGAAVRLRQLASSLSRNASTDARGQFNVAGLEPGPYELQVTKEGFQRTTKQIDVQPEHVARVDSMLSVGSVSEQVTVAASAAQVNTQSASLPTNKSAVRPLPDRLPAITTVVKGKLMLATDSAGALFLSRNAGKKWKAVKPVWKGKVVSLVTLSAPASSRGAAFQLTTDTSAVWLSRDGSHWYPAPDQH